MHEGGGGGCKAGGGGGSPVPRTALIAAAYALSRRGRLPLWNNLQNNHEAC